MKREGQFEYLGNMKRARNGCPFVDLEARSGDSDEDEDDDEDDENDKDQSMSAGILVYWFLTKGVPEPESWTWGRLVSPTNGREKKNILSTKIGLNNFHNQFKVARNLIYLYYTSKI
jgi:hypothetical protein